MTHCDDPGLLNASLGTVFVHDRGRDVVYIATEDGAAVEVPGPDLRELLEVLTRRQATPTESPYGDLLDRARLQLVEMEARLARECREAQGRLAALLTLPPAQRPGAVESDARFRTYSVAARALERSRHAVHHDPDLSRELADIGRQVAGRLNPQVYGASRVRDLQGYAEAVYANALRVSGDLRGAQAGFGTAREYLALGSPESAEALEIDDLETSLARDLRDFPRALALSDRVVAGQEALGQELAVARALQMRAILLDEMGEPEQAIAVLGEAEERARGCDSGMLALTIRHSRTLCCARAGRHQEASELFARTQGLYRQLSSPKVDACRLWAEGALALEAGRPADAVEPLSRSRSLFESHGYAFDAALVSLELAAALAALGRSAEVLELAAATYAFMESRQIHPDALAALAVFRQAAVREELSRELLRRLARRLERLADLRPPVS